MKSTSIPTFCVVGQSNQGKTTLLATLTEDDRLSISNMPGTTTAATEYPVKVDGEPVMTFWDTPGFENTSAVHEWFQKYAESSKNPAADFIASHRDNIDFRMESEIFRPISEGAAVIYIVDSSQRIRNSDKQQIDVLRRSGNPRLAVIYSKDGKWRHEEQWSRLLIQDFNIRAPFNAHSATAAERFRLLDRVQAMIPEWAEQMENAIGALKQDHDRKLSEAAGHLISMLHKVLSIRKNEKLDSDTKRENIHERLETAVRTEVRKSEFRFREAVRKTFGHSDEHWKLPDILNDDVFSSEVWKVLGLTKAQLVAAGAIIGALIGGYIDAHTGGASFLIGTATGAVVGGSFAFFSAERVALVSFPNLPLLGRRILRKKIGGAQATARVHPKSGLFGVLIDRALLYTEQAVNRPHGLGKTIVQELEGVPVDAAASSVDKQPDPSSQDEGQDSSGAQTKAKSTRRGLASTWSLSERKTLAKFIGTASKNKSDPIKLDAYRSELKRVIMKQFQILISSQEGSELNQMTKPKRSVDLES